MLFDVVTQYVLQLLLPALLIRDLLRKQYKSRLEWVIRSSIFGLVILFAFLTARWDWSSYYLRIIVPLLFLFASYMAFRRIEPSPSSGSVSVRWRTLLPSGLLFLILLGLNISVLQGYVHPSETVDLSYPLRGGGYYVGGGGTSRWLNNQSAFPPQNYALDIVRLNPLGNRALGIIPKDLSRYTIYGDRIYSPCSGVVAKAIDGYSDGEPPVTDRQNPAGNHLLIECRDVEVLLAHMMEGSVNVEEGDAVEEGEVVGRVGNSGNSSQPHLHIHVERGGTPGKILNGQGQPATFEGRFLVRNNLFTGR
jgi:hypothetical protein